MPIAEYVVDWFNNSYGFRNVAQRKLAVFAYSLQSVYEKKKDKRTCQFVRMCRLFHPMPNVMCELLLECTEIIADVCPDRVSRTSTRWSFGTRGPRER